MSLRSSGTIVCDSLHAIVYVVVTHFRAMLLYCSRAVRNEYKIAESVIVEAIGNDRA